MKTLKAFSRSHGGKYSLQPGIHPGDTRDYWLIFDSFHALASGWVSRSARIERSWGMIKYLSAGTKRVLSSYALVYVFGGEGSFSDERTKEFLPVREGDVMCLFPGVPHVYGPTPGTRWNEFIVEFSGPVFDAWMGSGLLDPMKPIRRLLTQGKDSAYWLKRLQDVVTPIAKERRDPSLQDTGALIALIAEMCATWQTHREEAEIEWAGKARAQLLAMPMTEELDLAKAARVFGLGEQAYRKKFKRLCGITPTLFRSRHVIEQACHRLIESNASVKEIAFDCGFSNEFYFSRRFKQITGVSPGEYRRRATE